MDIEWLGRHRSAQALGHHRRRLKVGLGHDDDELLAAEACDKIDAAHAAQGAIGQLAQRVVAAGMPELVVDRLEVVDVEHHQRGVADVAVIGHAQQQLFEMGDDVAAVVETGELVGQRQRQAAPVILMQPILQPLAAYLAADARQQLVPVNGADQIVVGAEVQPLRETRQLAFVGKQ